MKQAKYPMAAMVLACALSACSALSEIAYDSAAGSERTRCEKLESLPERQACLQRVNAANKQAEEARKGK